MRLITRHQLPSIHPRRSFVSLLFTISIFVSIGIILRATNQDTQSTAIINEPIVTKQKEVKLSEDKTILNQKIAPVQKENAWPLDAQGRSLKTNFLVLDWTGFFGGGATEGERVLCSSSNTTFVWTRQHNRIEETDFIIAHDGGAGGSIPFDHLHLSNDQQQYTMAFVMESEVHSTTGNAWARFNFIMTYNLDDSYPEPATYFDMNLYLDDLLRPPSVSFEDKEKQADAVWIISNCNAQNGREGFIQRLMQEIKIDSFGSCLNNRRGYGARMADNVDAYKKYKFVIAIENSNCADYVTEKLVKAVESGSIPIVAGRDGRPDYRRYMPNHSFINIFDYSSMKDLADDIKRIGNNKTLYESYLWYKKNDINIQNFKELPLTAKLKHVADIIGLNSTMLTSGIAAKEKSENKVCKLTRFVRQTPWQDIAAHNSTARAGPETACLPRRHLSNSFS